MEEHFIATSGVGNRDHEGLITIDNCHMRDETGIENLMQDSRVTNCIGGNSPYPRAWRGPGYVGAIAGQRIVQASVSTERNIPSISSNSF